MRCMSLTERKQTRRLFRAMRKGAGAVPQCGSAANQLGVRPGVDIPNSPDELVHPGTGGMSVAPDDPARLPPHVRPQRLGGHGKLPVFELDCAVIPPLLGVRLDPKHPERHAFVEPVSTMTVNEYQAALCATRAYWSEVIK
jgi:hypothetical protein